MLTIIAIDVFIIIIIITVIPLRLVGNEGLKKKII